MNAGWLAAAVLAIAAVALGMGWILAHLRARLNHQLLAIARTRSRIWYRQAMDATADLHGAVISLDLALVRNDALTDQRAALIRERDGLRAQAVQLRDLFEFFALGADDQTRALLERGRFYGLLPAEMFIPDQRTGDNS